MFCLDPPPEDDYFIYNTYGTFPFQFVQFSLTICNNKTMNNTCKSKEEINNVLSNGQVTILTPDIYFDNLNYLNPGTPYINLQTLIITSNLYKRYYLHFKSVYYITDNGIILPDYTNITYFQLDKVIQDVNLPGVATVIPNTIANFCFTMPSNVYNIYLRQYLSVPQILANLGGAFNSLMIICLVINFYVEKVLKEIEIFDICCTESLIKKNFKSVENMLNK